MSTHTMLDGALLAGAGLAALAGGAAWVRARRPRPLAPLLPAEHDFGKRQGTFRAALALLEARGARTLVETGTARGGLDGSRSDGASTVVFAAWAARHGATLHSVDLNPEAVARSRAAVGALGLDPHVRFHTGDSVGFLRAFDAPVDFLYLDSYDYDRKNEAVRRASQAHHLAELQAIESRLHERSVVLIDDCRLPGGGKGALVTPYLTGRGWRVARKAYQVLLVRAG